MSLRAAIILVHIFDNKQYITLDNSYKLLYTVYKSHGISYEEVKDMHIILNNSSMIPIYEQIVDQVKNQIIAGEISENEALPSVRTLSAELKISALTVKKAYDRLEEEGFVVTVHGKGTFVAATDKELAVEARRKAVEDDFTSAIEKAKNVGMTADEIREIVEIILEDETW